MERSGIGCQCGGAPTSPPQPGLLASVQGLTLKVQTKTAPAMDEHKLTTHQDPLINLLFDDGLHAALPACKPLPRAALDPGAPRTGLITGNRWRILENAQPEVDL